MEEQYKPFSIRESQNLKSLAFFKQRNWALTTVDLNENRLYSNLKSLCPYPRFTQICGGHNIYFPYAERFNVLAMIASDLKQEKFGYFNQIAYNAPGEGFRLVIDLDAENRVLTPPELVKITGLLDKVLCKYYAGQASIPIFVSTSGPKWKNGSECLSVHMVAHVQVSFMEAKQLIYSYRTLMTSEEGVDMRGLTLDDAIYKDKSSKTIYESCNLRMIYSYKKEKCINPEENHQNCMMCMGSGSLTVTKFYVPKFVMWNGKLDTELFKTTHGDFVQVFRNHGLWVEADHDVMQGYAIPHGTLSYENEASFEEDIVQGKVKSRKRKRRYDEQPISDTSMVKRFQCALRQITDHGVKPFPHIRVRHMTEYKSTTIHTVTIYVVGEGAGNCLYTKVDHGEGRIFFEYDVKNVKLKLGCFSEKKATCAQWKDKKSCIEFPIEPWVFTGTDPKQLPEGTHNAEITSLVTRARYAMTQQLPPDTSLSTLMRLTFQNPHCQFIISSPQLSSQ